jgi:hypothetical protein
MAIVGTVAAGTESKWGISEEATFGTAIADAGTFEQFEGPIPTGIDYGITRVNEPKFNGSRVNQDAEVYYTDDGGLRVIPFSDMVVRLKDLGLLTYSVTQVMDEGEAAAYAKTSTLDSSTTQPNFAANAGLFVTVGIYDTIASYHRKFTSCILRTLTLSADLAGDGRLMASGEWISGFAPDTTANFSGTWAYNTQTYYNFHTLTTKQIASTDIVLFGWDLTINNNAVRVGADSNGDAETYALPFFEVTGNLTVKYDTAVQGLIADSIAGTGRAIQLALATFDITLAESFFDNIGKDYGEARGQAITIPFKATHSTGTSMAAFTVNDSSDRGWPT